MHVGRHAGMCLKIYVFVIIMIILHFWRWPWHHYWFWFLKIVHCILLFLWHPAITAVHGMWCIFEGQSTKLSIWQPALPNCLCWFWRLSKSLSMSMPLFSSSCGLLPCLSSLYRTFLGILSSSTQETWPAYLNWDIYNKVNMEIETMGKHLHVSHFVLPLYVHYPAKPNQTEPIQLFEGSLIDCPSLKSTKSIMVCKNECLILCMFVCSRQAWVHAYIFAHKYIYM